MIARSRINVWLWDIMFRLVFRKKDTSKPPRHLLLRQLANGFSSVWVAIYLFVLVLAFLSIPRWFSGNIGRVSIFQLIFFVLSYVILMKISTIGGSSLRSWQYLIRESLFPISRTDFARELIRGGMFDMAIAAVGFSAGIILGLPMSDLQKLLSEITPLYIAMTIGQFFMLGFAMIWVVSFRSFIDRVPGIVGVAILSIILILSAISGIWSLSLASVVATAAGIAGFYRLAFRRWCNVELD